MGKKSKIFWHLIVPLLVWGMIAVVAIANPLPEEPDDLPPEAWSYYGGRPPQVQYVLKNRDAVLAALFLCAVGSGFFLWMVGYRD